MTKFKQLSLIKEQSSTIASTSEDVLKNKFLLSNCFEILSNPLSFKHLFEVFGLDKILN